jgi:hypothetical protein
MGTGILETSQYFQVFLGGNFNNTSGQVSWRRNEFTRGRIYAPWAVGRMVISNNEYAKKHPHASIRSFLIPMLMKADIINVKKNKNKIKHITKKQ